MPTDSNTALTLAGLPCCSDQHQQALDEDPHIATQMAAQLVWEADHPGTTPRPRYRIRIDRDTHPFVEPTLQSALGALEALLLDMEPDQEIIITRVDMTDAECAAMPEWTGP